ncbi:hypothetical protein TNCV_502791 [Trichonephila clavipes]|nr:hypothetical protein TNCV_502791 [Trichonephila clavipes]
MVILRFSKAKSFTSPIISSVMIRRDCQDRASSSKESYGPFHNTLTTQTVRQTLTALFDITGKAPSSTCCRWNGVQDGGLAVSNHQEDNFKELFRNTMKYISKEEYRKRD